MLRNEGNNSHSLTRSITSIIIIFICPGEGFAVPFLFRCKSLYPESFRIKDRAALVPLRACLIKHAFAKAMAVNNMPSLKLWQLIKEI